MNHKPGIYRMGRCQVIVTKDGLDQRWHLSISIRNSKQSPSYQELKAARYKYIPDHAVMAQLFPSQAEFVNFHPGCHHLWEVRGIEHEPQAADSI